MDVIIYPCWDLTKTMTVKRATEEKHGYHIQFIINYTHDRVVISMSARDETRKETIGPL